MKQIRHSIFLRALSLFVVFLLLASTIRSQTFTVGPVYGFADRAILNEQWTWIQFPNIVLSNPIVVASSLSYVDTQPAIVRIKGVTNNGFWAQIANFQKGHYGGAHNYEEVTWIAVENGHYTLSNGAEVDARTLTLAGGYSHFLTQSGCWCWYWYCCARNYWGDCTQWCCRGWEPNSFIWNQGWLTQTFWRSFVNGINPHVFASLTTTAGPANSVIPAKALVKGATTDKVLLSMTSYTDALRVSTCNGVPQYTRSCDPNWYSYCPAVWTSQYTGGARTLLQESISYIAITRPNEPDSYDPIQVFSTSVTSNPSQVFQFQNNMKFSVPMEAGVMASPQTLNNYGVPFVTRVHREQGETVKAFIQSHDGSGLAAETVSFMVIKRLGVLYT